MADSKQEIKKFDPDEFMNKIKSVQESDRLAAIDKASKIIFKEEFENDLIKSAITSNVISELQQALTPAFVSSLKNTLEGTKLGFRTDKDGKGGYHPDVIRTCIIEAILYNLRLHGNEFNIIAGQMYPTKEGLTNLIERDPNFEDLQINMDLPTLAKDPFGEYFNEQNKAKKEYKSSSHVRAVVNFKATWKYRGEEFSLEDKVVTKAYSYTTDEAIWGKAKRKIRAAVLERTHGKSFSAPDPEELKGQKERKVIHRPNDQFEEVDPADIEVLKNDEIKDTDVEKPMTEEDEKALNDLFGDGNGKD
jgi:hypothetical protein